jgi:hypothetical protein
VHVALETVGFVVAVLAVGYTVLSAIRAVVLPRASHNRLPQYTTKAVRLLFRLRLRSVYDYDSRDAIMAMVAPIALLAMLLAWLVVIFAAYALMYFCLGRRSFESSLMFSGSSVVTLGTTADERFWPSFLSYSEAGVGLLLVALLISYLPSIYGAFTRREAGVTLLQVRAGVPPRVSNMLIRYHIIEGRQLRLKDLWQQWENWFADIEESHTTFTILVHFRSPAPNRSWITSAGVLLDSAAMWIAAIEHPIDPDAQLCLRAGFIALRNIAAAFGIAYDADPRPDDPVSVTRQEWEHELDEMSAQGVPVKADRDEAWRAWTGWRVNYDTVLLRLGRLVEAPPAPWVSDRSPIGEVGRPDRRSTGWRKGRRRSPV